MEELSDISYNDLKESLTKHIEKCKIKARYHHENAIRAQRLENILTLTGITLNGLLSLLMIILTVHDTDQKTLAITSGCFGFASILVEKFRQNFNFSLLHYTHNDVSSEFMSLKYELIAILAEENYDVKDFKNIINKYLNVCNKGNVQSISC